MPIEKCRKVIFCRSFTAALLIVLVGGLIASLSSCGSGGGGGGGSASNPPGGQNTGGGSGADTAAVDAKAVSMAADILKGGDQTEPALQKALLDAGFSLKASDSLTPPTQAPSQGMLFDQWEVYAMAVGENNGGSISLSDFASAIQVVFPDLDTAQITAFLLDGINKSAQSNQPTVRLWARLIVELGRQSKTPYDLLDPNVDPTQADLSPVQLNLIGERLIGDLMTIVNQLSTGKSSAVGAHPAPPSLKPLPLATPTGVHYADSAPPCTLTENQGKITDGAATGATKGFEQLWEYLEKQELAAAEKLGKISGAANNIAIYLKLAWTLAAFDGGFLWNGLEDPVGPLVRNTSTAAGKQAAITLGVDLNIGNAQIMNCLRLAGNAVGLDFSLWNDGPIKNAGVQWVINKGLTSGGSTGPASLGYLEWASGVNPVSGRFTDEKGEDKITIEGAPRKKTITNPEEVDKPGQVIAKVNLKSADIFQDLIDATATAGSAVNLVNFPPEMLYRTGWTFAKELNFTVIDWDECDTSSGKPSKALRAAGVCSNTWTGTASFSFGGSVTTSANVTWVFDRADGNLVHYKPTGTASYTFPNCVTTPPSTTMSTEPGGGTGGELVIDFSVDPPSYHVFGATVYAVTYSCANGVSPPLGTTGMWVGDPGTLGPVTGSVTVDDKTHKLTISGAATGLAGSTSWSFTKD